MEYDGIMEALLFAGFMVGNFINPNCVIRDADGCCCFHSLTVCVGVCVFHASTSFLFFFLFHRESAASDGVVVLFFSTPQSGSYEGVTRSTHKINIPNQFGLNANLTLGVSRFYHFNCVPHSFIYRKKWCVATLFALPVYCFKWFRTQKKVHFPIKQ